MPTEGQKEAVKTYLEQTKLLVALASAFIFAPAGLVGILKDKTDAALTSSQILWFIWAEGLFILSVLFGYVTVATLVGSQASNEFNVYRCATRLFSFMQIFAYIGGTGVFLLLAVSIVRP